MRIRGKQTASEEEQSSEVAYESTIDEQTFYAFVNEQIELVKKYSLLGKNGFLTFEQLNKALSTWGDTNAALISLYNIAKMEHSKEQEDFDDWYAQKYLLIREIENPKSAPHSKWASQKEIDMIVRTQYAEEYRSRKKTLLVKEHQVSFLRRLLESWTTQQFILSTLSKNLQAEVAGLYVNKD